jgi:hypothetical protein
VRPALPGSTAGSNRTSSSGPTPLRWAISSSETALAHAATPAGEVPWAVIWSTLASVSAVIPGRGRRSSSSVMRSSAAVRRLSLWAVISSAGSRKLICWIDKSASVSSARSSTSVDDAE